MCVNVGYRSSKLIMSMTIGSHVKHSYSHVFRRLTKLSRKCSVDLTLSSTQAKIPEAIIEKTSSAMPAELSLTSLEDQVAMDFSGNQGKLVTNCKEIEDLKNTRPHTRLSPRVSGNQIIHTTTNTDLDLDAELCDISWFHGLLSREEASTLMKEEGLQNGLFMVRKSCKVNYVYMLTFCMNEQINHCQILLEKDSNNEMCYSLANGPVFQSVDNLIEHYKQKPVNGLSVALRKPCQKRRKSLTLPIIIGAESLC